MQDAMRRPRRHHSSAVKAEILPSCAQPGASVAGIALQYGINANLVHHWRRRAEGALAEFVPLTLSNAPVVTGADDIRIELRRGTSRSTVSIAWPTSAAVVCASWLRELVK